MLYNALRKFIVQSYPLIIVEAGGKKINLSRSSFSEYALAPTKILFT